MASSNGRNPVADLMRLVGPVRGKLAWSVAGGAVSGVSGVVGFTCGAMAITELFAGRPSRTAVALWIGGALASLLVGFASRSWAYQVAHLVSYELEVVLRRQLAGTLARIPLGEVQRLGSGRIKKVMQDDVRALHNVVADSLPIIGSAAAQPVAALVLLGLVQWRLLLVVLLVAPVAVGCISLLSRDYGEQRMRYDQANEDINAAMVEFVQGMPVVRTFDDGRTSFHRYSARVRTFTEAIAAWTATSRRPAMLTRWFIVPLPTLLALVLAGALMLGAGWITAPQLMVALVIGAFPVESILPLMHLTNWVNDSKAGAARIIEVLEIPPQAEPAEPREPVGSAVTLTGVRFSYSADRDRPALDGVDIDIPAGTVCALVGPSGSGKSTLARLIPRFYDVDAGSVRVGGVDVREMRSDVLLRHVALVFQEPFLVEGTVDENIRLARPGASDEEVRAAAVAAAAHEFIMGELPDGYDSQVGERGGRLSGGQRQRITIARAILSGAPIVVLDEATAFADPENEVAIQSAIARLTRGRTVVIIAHRLSTIVEADQIVVLDEGRVVERGRHPDLLAAGGRYARLWAHHERAASWGLAARKSERLPQ